MLLTRLFIVILINCLSMVSAWAGVSEPVVRAKAAVLMEVSNGQILYAKNGFEKLAPASTTKVLTALLVLDYGIPGQKIKVSSRAASVGEASIFLQPGEELTVEDLLKGTLIKSGNDAAYALAESVAGSALMFANLMDRKALALGAVNSHFINPNGLPSSEHLTTAHDLAMFTREALKKPLFNEIVKTEFTSIPWGQHDWQRSLRNTNKLLMHYPGADGIKTGTTRQAGSCLIASATRNDRRLIAVLLNSGDRYGDAQRLLDYGFDNFQSLQVAAGSLIGSVMTKNQQRVPLATRDLMTLVVEKDSEDELEACVKLSRELNPPIPAGEVVGEYNILLGKQELAHVPVVTSMDLEVSSSFFCRYFNSFHE